MQIYLFVMVYFYMCRQINVICETTKNVNIDIKFLRFLIKQTKKKKSLKLKKCNINELIELVNK